MTVPESEACISNFFVGIAPDALVYQMHKCAQSAPNAPNATNSPMHQMHQRHQNPIHQCTKCIKCIKYTKCTKCAKCTKAQSSPNALSKSARPRISQPWSLKWPFTAINVNFTAFARIEGRRDFTSLDKAKDDSMSKNSFLRMGK